MIFMFFVSFCYSQRTVEVARLYVVNLYFEENIESIQNGDPLYFEIERYENRISIRVNPELASKERHTNITLISESGNVYTVLLKTVETPNIFNISFTADDAVVRMKKNKPLEPSEPPKQQAQAKIVEEPKHYYNAEAQNRTSRPLKKTRNDLTDSLYVSDKIAYMKKKVFYAKGDKPDLFRYFAKSGKVYLHLYAVNYNNNELYLFLNLENQEGLDFDVNSLHTSIGTTKKKKNTYQKIKVAPILKYDVPTRVEGGEGHLFALVFDKFSLDKNKSLFIDIDELNGGRNIQLAIDHKVISNPKKF